MISRKSAEIGFAVANAPFGAVVAYGATEFGVGWSPSGPEPGTFPFYIVCIVTLASFGNLAGALVSDKFGETLLTREQGIRILSFVVPMIGFVALSLVLGLYVATAIYMFGVMMVQGRYPAWHAALVAVGLPLALYFILEKGFRVPLLKGPLEAALGF